MLKAYEVRAQCFVKQYSQYGTNGNKVPSTTPAPADMKQIWILKLWVPSLRFLVFQCNEQRLMMEISALIDVTIL
jgi:hypothetical protein